MTYKNSNHTFQNSLLATDILRSIEEGNRLAGHQESIRADLLTNPKSIVVLDDDPTGTQTVFDVPVITEWSEAALEQELLESPIFFVLTNSRSLQIEAANDLGKLIGERLGKLAAKIQKHILVISRSDSTLRGHYPNEVNALTKGLEWPKCKHILAPAFFDGGRYTYHDVHYVKEGDGFIPAGETPFAKDSTFGYNASNLREWVIEKSDGKVLPEHIESVSIDVLREQSPASVNNILNRPDITHIIVNATSNVDLQTMALACLRHDGPLIFRTGASFVNALSGIAARSCLTKNEVLGKNKTGGALIIIGSYVPKTTQQLSFLKENSDAIFLELDVSQVLDVVLFQQQLTRLATQIDDHLKSEKEVVLYTSRTVITGKSKTESLTIVNKVSNGLITIVRELSSRPKYVLAKGGITSSDIATKGLSVKRAKVLGQVLKGVPVWKLDAASKFPDMPYIVFPGNVGDKTALHELIQLLK